MNDLQEVPHKNIHVTEHKRGYKFGDMRCTACHKWLDPSGLRFPDELQEIAIGKGGRRRHAKMICPVNSTYGSILVKFPKFHPARRERRDSIKRY